MLSEWQFLYRCHLPTSLPARRVPWKFFPLHWSKWKGVRVTVSQQSSRNDSCLTHKISLLTNSNFRTVLSLHGESFWRQMHLNHIIGISCHKIAAFQFLSGSLCATHGIWQVKESHLWLPIFPIYFLCLFLYCKAITGENQLAVCTHPYSVLKWKISGKYCLEKKNKRTHIWEIQIRSYILILWWSKCLLVDNS